MPAHQDATHLSHRIADEFVTAAHRGDDLGAILSHALVEAARTLGSVTALVSGHPGSRESDLLLRLAQEALAHPTPVAERIPASIT